MIKNTTTSASIALIIGCIIFGLGSVIVASVAIGTFSIAFWRLAVAGVIFFVATKLAKQRLPQAKRAIIFSLCSGAFLGIDLALWHESIHAVGPGISTLLNSLQIFFLAAIGFLLFNERQTPLQLISLILAIIGVALIGSPEFTHNSQATWGFVSGIISGGMLAGSMTCIRKAHESESVAILPLMLMVSIGGCAVLLPIMLLLEWGHIFPTTWQDVGWILVYGAVMQCLAWGLIARSIPKLSLALTGLLLLSEPVAALIIDYAWLNKPISWLQWFGAGLTMLAIYLGSLKPKSHKLRRFRFFGQFYRKKS